MITKTLELPPGLGHCTRQVAFTGTALPLAAVPLAVGTATVAVTGSASGVAVSRAGMSVPLVYAGGVYSPPHSTAGRLDTPMPLCEDSPLRLAQLSLTHASP